MTALRGTWLTVAEVALRMGVSESYVRRLIRDGRLDGMRLGGKLFLVAPQAVRRFKRRPRGRPRSKKPPKPTVEE